MAKKKDYTVVYKYPDYLIDGTDDGSTAVDLIHGADPKEAIAAFRKFIRKKMGAIKVDANDFLIVAMFEGDLTDVNPE